MSNFDYSNPYQATLPYSFHTQAQPLRLASRPKRFLGALIDNVAMLFSLVPGFAVMIGGVIATSSSGGPDAGVAFVLGGMGLMVLGMLVTAGIQIYLIAVSSQSIGKYFLR